MGTSRAEFESAFCETSGAPAARAFGRGREALLVLLKALGVGPGDRVGICGYTCLSVVEPVLLAGAVPVYLDVDEYACIDPASLAACPRGSLKLVIVQHTFGSPGRLDELLDESRRIGAMVVEDCAHAPGGAWDGTPLGRFGEAAIYSFGWGKPLSIAQGGVLTANSRELPDRIDAESERLAQPQLHRTELRLAAERRGFRALDRAGRGYDAKVMYLELCRRGVIPETYELRGSAYMKRGYVRLMGEATARAGLKALCDWPELMACRRANADLISKRLRERRLPTWPRPCRADVTMLAYPMLVADKPATIAAARRQGLDVGGWYESPVHPLMGDAVGAAGYEPGSCPWGEEFARHLVHIPTDSPSVERTVDLLAGMISRRTAR